MHFDLKKPCKGCPFRTDCLPGWLGDDRAAEIATSIKDEGKTFPCHKTTVHDDDDCYMPTGKEQHCAGALLLIEKDGGFWRNQMLRIAAALRLFDPGTLNRDAAASKNVFTTFKAFIKHHS